MPQKNKEMKICFSWLKKTLEDADRLSSLVSVFVCVALFAGTLALAAEKCVAEDVVNEAGETRQNVPARIVLRLENIVRAVAEEVAEVENTPEETPFSPPAPKIPEPQPVPPKPEKTMPEKSEPVKIDDSALREKIIEETPPKPEKPKEKIPEATPPKKTQSAPPEPVPAEDSAAQVAAEQSLYGALAEAVSRRKFYPRAARRNGRTGTVFMRVTIGVCGKIKAYELEKSSAHKSLIAGAKETLRRVSENFCAPAGTQAVLPAEFILPIIYELRET